MNEVVLEVQVPGGWKPLGSVAEVESPGSISTEEDDGRQVYVFGWRGDTPGVWRSVGGYDVENSAVRLITCQGFEQLSDLSMPYEMQHGERIVRFVLRSEPELSAR